MSCMGRPRTKRKDLPEGLYHDEKRGFYYRSSRGDRLFVHIGKVDRAAAIKRWAELNGMGEAESGCVSELIERYQREMLPTKTGKTLAEYARMLGKLSEEFGKRRYPKTESQAATGEFIRRMDINRYLREYPSPVMANRTIVVFKQVFELARDNGLCEYNPCIGVRHNVEKPRDRLITHSEYARIKHAAPPVLRLIMLMGRLTGMRESDLLALSWAQIKGNEIQVTQKKTKKKQDFYITKPVRAILEATKLLRGNLRSLQYVFHQPNGKRYTESALQSMWRRSAIKAGVEDVHFHDLRAKAVTDAIQRGQDGQKLAGHTTSEMTQKVYNRAASKVRPVK